MDRKKILSAVQNDEDKLVISKIIDTAEFAENKNCVKITGFLNGHQIMLAKKCLSEYEAGYEFYGGYEEFERGILLCYPSYYTPQKEDYPISIIYARAKNGARLSHRDYTGAVLNLGISRDKIGDIVVFDDGAYIVCISNIAEYIVNNINKVGKAGVELSVSDCAGIKVPPRKFKEIKASVSSLRLDSLIAEALGMSRSEASSLITKGDVRVNWEVKCKNDFKPTEGDIFSVHGHGRILLYRIGGLSKKGRIFVTLKRYI
ncbi:MAG: hypothetical protein IJQ50_04210 [Clostridia bacterium]|nr:hypothetical protein [Clostridia bacterium]